MLLYRRSPKKKKSEEQIEDIPSIAADASISVIAMCSTVTEEIMAPVSEEIDEEPMKEESAEELMPEEVEPETTEPSEAGAAQDDDESETVKTEADSLAGEQESEEGNTAPARLSTTPRRIKKDNKKTIGKGKTKLSKYVYKIYNS